MTDEISFEDLRLGQKASFRGTATEPAIALSAAPHPERGRPILRTVRAAGSEADLSVPTRDEPTRDAA